MSNAEAAAGEQLLREAFMQKLGVGSSARGSLATSGMITARSSVSAPLCRHT